MKPQNIPQKGKCTLEVDNCNPVANVSKSAGKSPETSVARMLGAQHQLFCSADPTLV